MNSDTWFELVRIFTQVPPNEPLPLQQLVLLGNSLTPVGLLDPPTSYGLHVVIPKLSPKLLYNIGFTHVSLFKLPCESPPSVIIPSCSQQYVNCVSSHNNVIFIHLCLHYAQSKEYWAMHGLSASPSRSKIWRWDMASLWAGSAALSSDSQSPGLAIHG